MAAMSNDSGKKKILIVNQHGENRGDEAAMRAMLSSLERELGNVTFDVVVQFKDRSLTMSFPQDVHLHHMIMPITHALGFGLYAVAKLFKLELPVLLSARTRKVIEAYQSSDMVISAPGGPYFGDIYYKHELAHWFYIWLAGLYKKPLFLYAPSAGPFAIKVMNLVRKFFYKKFDVLCVREEISQGYLQKLLGDALTVHVTADSALQETLEPYDRKQYFTGERASLAKKYLVSVSAIQYKYPGEKNVAERQTEYTQVILKCMEHISLKRTCHFLLFPQLYGCVHSDVPYLEQLGRGLKSNVSWEIADPGLDSDMHRRLFGMTDLCIASRYHPQIFAATSSVPGICIYYEHKAIGFMSLLGLQDFAFDIRTLDVEVMCDKLNEVIDNHDRLSEQINKRVKLIREQARLTTRLAVDLYYREKGQTYRDDI